MKPPPKPAKGTKPDLVALYSLGYCAALDDLKAWAEKYEQRMFHAASRPHPITGTENRIAPCKQDAAASFLGAITIKRKVHMKLWKRFSE